MKRAWIVTLLASVTLLGRLAVAEEGGKPGEGKPGEGKPGHPRKPPAEIFKMIDTDQDGKLSLDEVKNSPRGKKDPAKAEEMFKKKDKDGDGFLSPKEFMVGMHPPKHKDGDGHPPKGDK
jgi:EF-hand domain pair